MNDQRRSELVEELLGLELQVMRARFEVQPPPLLNIDVTMLQFKALMTTFCVGADTSGVRVSDLARYLNLSAATASTLLDRLVDRKLIERREDPQDRRQHLCRPSPEGQQLIVTFFESMRAQSRELLDVLTEDELLSLMTSMNILIRAAGRVRDAAGVSPAEPCLISEVAARIESTIPAGASASTL